MQAVNRDELRSLQSQLATERDVALGKVKWPQDVFDGLSYYVRPLRCLCTSFKSFAYATGDGWTYPKKGLVPLSVDR